jgi:hypothetical protein
MLELHIKSDEAMFNHIAEKTGKKKRKEIRRQRCCLTSEKTGEEKVEIVGESSATAKVRNLFLNLC